jgi:hypothetical protein
MSDKLMIAVLAILTGTWVVAVTIVIVGTIVVGGM